MEQNRVIDDYMFAFTSAMHEIESLEEFYQRSLKTVNEYNSKVQLDYAIGIKISKLFNSVLEIEGVEEKNRKIEEIKEERIDESLMLKDICEIEQFSEDDKPLRYSMPDRYFLDSKYSPLKAQRRVSNVRKYRKILIGSVISHILVIFENFLSDIYRIQIKKDALKYLGDQTIKFADLIKEGQDAVSTKIDQVIEAGLRDSLTLLGDIVKKEELCIDRYEPITKEFAEIYYRRNAYIHTNGCVNADYIKKVDKQYTTNLKIGDLLVCRKEYLENAIHILIKIVFSLIIELLQKEDNIEDPVDFVAAYFFERLCSKQYEISKYVYLSLCKIQALSFESRSMYKVNYINACKQLGDRKTVDKELRKFDVTAMHAKFVIAKHCLANEAEKVYNLLSRTYPDSFDAISIRDWPIFINFRETKEYQKFVEEHKNDFKMQEMTAEDSEYKRRTRDTTADITQEANNEITSSSSDTKGTWIVVEGGEK